MWNHSFKTDRCHKINHFVKKMFTEIQLFTQKTSFLCHFTLTSTFITHFTSNNKARLTSVYKKLKTVTRNFCRTFFHTIRLSICMPPFQLHPYLFPTRCFILQTDNNLFLTTDNMRTTNSDLFYVASRCVS